MDGVFALICVMIAVPTAIALMVITWFPTTTRWHRWRAERKVVRDWRRIMRREHATEA